jgi:hypothetical protein
MKNNYLHIIIAGILLLAHSCSNDFLNENIDPEKFPTGESAIIISPDWITSDYQFSCPIAKSVEFTIEKAPEWMQVASKSGELIYTPSDTPGTTPRSIGIIQAKAIANPAYAKFGVYIDNMKIKADGKIYNIPVYYISEGNPAVEVNRTLTLNYNSYYYANLQIQNTGNGILIWNLVSLPSWLDVNMELFNPGNLIVPSGQAYQLPLALDINNIHNSNSLNGSIVLSTNDESNPEVVIQVSVQLGTPTLSTSGISGNQIDFGSSGTTKSVHISNQGNGILIWELDNLPEWLSASSSNGILSTYNSEAVSFTCDRDKLLPGLNTATILLKSNDAGKTSTSILVTARTAANNDNIYAIEGSIIDASFNKSTNILYYATSQPNKLVLYDVTNKNILHEIPLSKAPTCLTVSEDYTKALVGHGGRISVINLSNQTVTNTYEVQGVLSDIEFAANNWCAYTEGGNYNIQHTNIYWVDLSTGSVTNGSGVYEDCFLRKVPNQDYIIGSELEVSSGLYVYDINNKTEKADIFESFNQFWFAEDYIISSNGNVWRISDILSKNGWVSSGLSAIGKLQFPGDNNYARIPNLDYCPAKRSIFSLSRSDWSTISSNIYQFEDNDYTLVKSYSYDNLYKPQGQSTSFEVEAYYVFANNEGTLLSVLRKGKSNSIWSLEFIQITD